MTLTHYERLDLIREQRNGFHSRLDWPQVFRFRMFRLCETFPGLRHHKSERILSNVINLFMALKKSSSTLRTNPSASAVLFPFTLRRCAGRASLKSACARRPQIRDI